MRLNFCAVCGVETDLHHHHFKAKSHGGDDLDTNMLTLCTEHHREIHGQNYRNDINHSKLTREGLQRAKERGVRLGAPVYSVDAQEKARKEAQQFSGVILPLRKQGASLRNICEVLNASGMKTSRGGSFHPSLVSRMITILECNFK
jgi:DNA invertase Pin-like site-specific DNA recombinase